MPWSTWPPATCLPDDCFCEALAEGSIRQPANTWSSLAFLLTAVWVVWRHANRETRRPPALGRTDLAVYVATLVTIGLASAFYHPSLTFVGQVLDVSGMYFMATFILLHRLGPRWNLPPILSVLVFVAANAVLMVGQVTTPSLRRVVFGILLITAIVLEWRSSPRGRSWLGAGAALMGLAFAIWGLDRLRIVCAPTSVFQGHALWHMLGASAAACLFKRYELDAYGLAAKDVSGAESELLN